MLRRTFSHIPGIGEKKEIELWECGVSDWLHLYDDCGAHFSGKRQVAILEFLEASLRNYERRNLSYFYKSLPRKDLWRMLPGHESETAFIDIETTGLALPPYGQVTTLAVLLDGKLHLAHEHAEKKKILRIVEERANLIVTYFGENFDIPYLRKQYKRKLDMAHVDLCFALRRNKLTGGLKVVEKNAKILFKRKAVGLDGASAVELWRMYEEGEQKALETLLAYNAEDAMVLQPLAERLVAMEAKKVRDESLSVKFKRLPKVPYRACPKITKRVQALLFDSYW